MLKTSDGNKIFFDKIIFIFIMDLRRKFCVDARFFGEKRWMLKKFIKYLK